jgi:diguanylate cyclase (GGDEF)-like protein
LTAAANGRTFYEVAQLELLRLERTGRPLTVAYLDVDNFKAVNDRQGHAAGDALLRRVAETVQKHTRANDLLARLGGDEFALLLPDTAAENAVAVLQRLREALLREVIDGPECRVTFSIGAATFLQPPGDVDAMVRRVDALMYVVKRGGKDRVHHEVVQDADAASNDPPSEVRNAKVCALGEQMVRVIRDGDPERRTDFAIVRDLSASGIGLQLSHSIEPGTLVTVEPVRGGRARTLLARVLRADCNDGDWLHTCELAQHLNGSELRDWLA